MRTQNQKGFTLIEVILYFALSSAFIVIAFIGIQGRTANVQFTDSMRSLQSYLISEQNKVLNGVNSNTTVPAGCELSTDPNPLPGKNDVCILLGRIVTFGSDPTDLSKIIADTMYGERKEEGYFQQSGI